jgi:4-carboxymuconolactone decarboxylase
MSDTKIDLDVLKATFGDAAERDPNASTRMQSYEAMAGFAPPRVKARLAVSGAIDPVLLDLQEKTRAHTFSTPYFDEKTKQLMIFGIMLGQLNDAAKVHAIAARRAGASWEELHAVIGLCYTFRGVPAANRGAEMLAEVAMHESKEATS